MSKTTIVWSSKSIPDRILEVMTKSRRARPWTLAELADKAEASTGSTATALVRLVRLGHLNREVLWLPKNTYVFGYTKTSSGRTAAKR